MNYPVYEIKEDAITSFRKENSFLSNLYSYKVILPYKGFAYNCVEAAYMGQKDPSKAELFSKIIRPDLARKIGRTVKITRPNWDEIKFDLMRELVFIKFRSNERLKEKLLATGNLQLVEGNTWGDHYWGVCDGTGFNKLGEILMEVRDTLRKESKGK